MEEVIFKIFKKNRLFIINYNLLFIIIFILLVINRTFLYFTAFMFFSWGVSLLKRSSYKPLNGKLEGEICLTKNKVIANQNEYLLNDISQIKIFANDIKGSREFIGFRNNVNGRLSNGVSNYIFIKLKNKEHLKFYFQQKDIMPIAYRKILIHYHFEGKMTFMQLYDALGLGYEEIQELKKELKNSAL